jgi:hypothetical protein
LVCVCVYSVRAVLCLGRGIAISWSPVPGVLPSGKWSMKLIIQPYAPKLERRGRKKTQCREIYVLLSLFDNQNFSSWTFKTISRNDLDIGPTKGQSKDIKDNKRILFISGRFPYFIFGNVPVPRRARTLQIQKDMANSNCPSIHCHKTLRERKTTQD